MQLPEIPLTTLMEVFKINNDEFIGNLSSFIKIIICITAPSIAIWLGSDENTVIALLTAIAGMLFSLIDMKYPNTLFGGENEE